MRLRIFLATAAVCLSGPVMADSLDINLSNHTVEGTYATNWRAAEFNTGILYNNDRDDWVASAGLLTSGQKMNNQTRIEGGLGGKIFGASVSNNDVLALGLGGQFRVFPNNGPVGFGAYAYYAPDIVSFMDAKKFWEAGARVELEIVKKSANLYVGYRKVRANLDNGSHQTVDSGGNVGVKISF